MAFPAALTMLGEDHRGVSTHLLHKNYAQIFAADRSGRASPHTVRIVASQLTEITLFAWEFWQEVHKEMAGVDVSLDCSKHAFARNGSQPAPASYLVATVWGRIRKYKPQAANLVEGADRNKSKVPMSPLVRMQCSVSAAWPGDQRRQTRRRWEKSWRGRLLTVGPGALEP